MKKKNSFDLYREARCGACGDKIDRPNLVELNRQATWKYPTGRNILTGETGRAVAIVCDGCIRAKMAIREAVEFTEGEIVYHPLETIPELPTPRTFTVSRSGRTIKCLRCGHSSRDPDDVLNHFCPKCQRFHDV